MPKLPPPPLSAAATTTTTATKNKQNTRRKKKGRPSLLDLQKRSIKQQQNQHQTPPKSPNPNPNRHPIVSRRSTRRNPKRDSDSDEGDEEEEEEEEEDKLDSVLDSSNYSAEDKRRNNRKRKFEGVSEGSGNVKAENHDPAGNAHEGAKFEDGPLTPLPDKKLLLFILDRLQKKDTYGVFADPVDPEELPDYHEVIDEPMDFSTVRSKLDRGAYAYLEQFEKDIFLICSNAMRYNAPDTVYFRQARSIQELAKKDFENLMQDSDDNESETKVVRRGRPPLFKNLKKSLGKPPEERVPPDHSGATLASRADSSNRPILDTRKGSPVEKLTSADPAPRTSVGSRQPEAYPNWSAERFGRNDEITGSQSKGNSMKYGKKQIVADDSRRSTSVQPFAPPAGHDSAVLSLFNSERKVLVPANGGELILVKRVLVGLQAEYGYARSLARFAAKLGPVAWKVASKKIMRCLPNGVKFGPGWVGENEATAQRRKLPPSPTSASQPLAPRPLSVHGNSPTAPTSSAVDSAANMPQRRVDESRLDEKPMPCSQPSLDANPSKHVASVSPSAEAPDASVSPTLAGAEAARGLSPGANSLKSNVGLIRPGLPFQAQLRPTMNGFYGTFGFNNPSQMGKLIGGSRPAVSSVEAQMVPSTTSKMESSLTRQPAAVNYDKSAISKLTENQNPSLVKSSDGLSVSQLPKVEPAPSGRAKTMQPDLALQL
ncbi:Bromodomain and PHD finger-containing protein [Drosera capensis]